MKRTLLSILVIGILLLGACATPTTAPPVEAPPTEQPTPTTYTLSVSVSPSGAGSVSPSDGQYQEGVQVILTATPASGYTFDYWDDDASGSSATITIIMDSDKSIIAHFSVVDTTPPVILEVSVSEITETTAIVIWTTDEPATSHVEYGKTTDYGLTTTLDKELATSHSISLSGLEPNTTYHFRVKSVDKAGNKALSGDYTFTTSEPAPKVEVQILEHHLVREDYPPPTSFSMTFVRGKVKNTGDVTLASLDVTIWVQYEVEGLEDRVFNMPGSIDLEPAAFKPGEVRDFEVLVQNGAREGYEISVSIMLP